MCTRTRFSNFMQHNVLITFVQATLFAFLIFLVLDYIL
jgi:hypothetical protein